jgi:hypothetical protein
VEQLDESEAFKYLPFVTLSQCWAAQKGAATLWLIFTLAGGLLLFVGTSVVPGDADAIFESIPPAARYVVGFALIAWFFRGTEIKIAFPRSFRLWLFAVGGVAAVATASHLLPTWAMVPVYVAILCGLSALDSLAAIGRRNYEANGGLPEPTS